MNIVHLEPIFLLGGCDLEMETIKQMLGGRSDCVVMDRHLRWDNARLSAYQDNLTLYSDRDVYGIELMEDAPLPNHYHRIDHHNDWAHKPSALEQTAAIVGVALNREQQLIAANDKGYIPAMQAMGATDAEISDIRQRDRIAQGVTEQDEQQAEQSVNQFLSQYEGLLVVKSLTSCFSPICDRLFPYKRLLIYTDSQWMFYGDGKSELVIQYANEITQKKVFHGGGNNGYIGCVENAYSKMQIGHLIEQIIKDYGNV